MPFCQVRFPLSEVIPKGFKSFDYKWKHSSGATGTSVVYCYSRADFEKILEYWNRFPDWKYIPEPVKEESSMPKNRPDLTKLHIVSFDKSALVAIVVVSLAYVVGSYLSH